jgi:hypothetical protein
MAKRIRTLWQRTRTWCVTNVPREIAFGALGAVGSLLVTGMGSPWFTTLMRPFILRRSSSGSTLTRLIQMNPKSLKKRLQLIDALRLRPLP